MPGKSAPKNETPEQRFVRLANGRWINACKAIDGLGKLVGPAYKSTADQHKKLFDTIRAKMAKAEKSLSDNKAEAVEREGIL